MGDNSPSEEAVSSMLDPDNDTATEGAILETTDLYHYTSVDGLYGILENRQLWATHAGYLNDTDEFKYGLGATFEELRFLRADIESKRPDGPEEPPLASGLS